MAVFKNYYNRSKPFGGNNQKWSITISCLYLLCSSIINCTIVNGERVRHQHHTTNKIEQDIYVSQLEKSAIDEQSLKTPLVTNNNCPNCLYKTDDRELKSATDNLRLEAIKQQILSKLGLRHKPNITYSLPREVIMETLFRAEDSNQVFNNLHNSEENISTTSARTSTIDHNMDFDDFYGHTSEIISFAEQGSRVNQNRLLEFWISTESGGQAGQEFRVRTATLWLKADIRHRRPQKCRSTEIYVFKIISRLPETVTLSSQEFDRATSDPISITLQESNTGWQKLDLTELVRKWLTEPTNNKDKLRLFVDCSCCSHWHIHLFNTETNKKPSTNPNRPFLVIHTDPNITKRVRRRALDCSADSGNQCCKQRFYVSFKQLGWDDWVIAPQGYYANYCRGDCGNHRTPDTYVTYHTHVIEEVRKTNHLSGMQPCCAPLKFSSMSLIYYGPDLTIIKRDLPKMVVDECGCP